MIFLIAYDISDDRTRYKVSRLLEGMGERVQESVFECRLPSDKINQVSKALSGLLEKGGNVRIYPLHSECYNNAIGIGDFTKTLAADGYGVF